MFDSKSLALLTLTHLLLAPDPRWPLSYRAHRIVETRSDRITGANQSAALNQICPLAGCPKTDALKSKYVIVTPVRDEETYLPFTIQSIAKQTVLPVEWVIVNDGSKDRTGEIIEEASIEYPWIHPVHRSDRGYRKWGGGIIEAFYDGFNALECQDWAFMCKLDGDLSFDPGYFEGTFKKFEENPKNRNWRRSSLSLRKRETSVGTDAHLPCEGRRQDFPPRVLERYRWTVGRAGLRHDRRGQGEHAWDGRR